MIKNSLYKARGKPIIVLPILFIMIIIFCLPSINTSSIEDPNQIYFNSDTYYNNYLDLVQNFFRPEFNSTQIFNGSKLWVPWYDSSTACAVANLKNTYVSNPTMDNNTMVSDEFSEIGILLSLSNITDKFRYWNNTIDDLDSPYGSLPCWVASRDGNNTACNSNDTASDATARIALAYYYASTNLNFSEGDRNYYQSRADDIVKDHLIYEVKHECWNVTFGDTEVCYWVGGGRNAVTGGFASDPFIYTGYFPDLIKMMIAGYVSTHNNTYLTIIDDYIEQYLHSANITADDEAGISPFSWRWDVSVNPVNIYAGNPYYFSSANVQWDDSDSPRTLMLCDVLRVANITFNASFSAALTNLSNYCYALTQTLTYNATKTCIQPYYNWTSCGTSVRGGYYENGLGAGLSTYYNTSFLKEKVNESLSHYAFGSPYTYDYVGCYGVYRAVRPAKSLAIMIGLTDALFSYDLYTDYYNLYDNFNDNSFDETKWVKGEQTGGLITESGQVMNLTLNTSAGGYLNLKTNLSLDSLTGNITFLVSDATASSNAWLSISHTNALSGVTLLSNLKNYVGDNVTIIKVNGTYIKVYVNNILDSSYGNVRTNASLDLIINNLGKSYLYIDNFYINSSIDNLLIDNCTSYNYGLFNFTLVDEETQNTLTSGTEIELEINIYTLDRNTLLYSYSNISSSINPARVCLSSTPNFEYSLDAVVRYDSTNTANEYYNIYNATLDMDYFQNITLYSLNDSDTTEFRLTLRGEDYLPLEDALIYLERQYIQENAFKTVELPKTDTNGQTILHLVRNDVVYNLIAIKDGEIIARLDNFVAYCEDYTIGDCKIELSSQIGLTNVFNYDDDIGLFVSGPSYNNNTRIVSFSFATADSSSTLVNLSVTRNDIFGNKTLCNEFLTSASGSLSCTIPSSVDDTTLVIKVYSNNNLAILKYLEMFDRTFGTVGYLIFFVMLLSFVFMFSESKNGILIAILLGYGAGIGLGLLTGSIIGIGSSGIWLIIITVIGFWRINKGRPS